VSEEWFTVLKKLLQDETPIGYSRSHADKFHGRGGECLRDNRGAGDRAGVPELQISACDADPGAAGESRVARAASDRSGKCDAREYERGNDRGD
jgi:hypothetical protein